MNCCFFKNIKAAAFSAAFLFAAPAIAAPTENIASFENIKQKATELLLQRKKNQALQLIINYSKTQSGTLHRTEANELLINIAQKFIQRDAQEAYENSLNLTLENSKEAMKSNEQCLSSEPYQLDCLIQKMRLLSRAKNSKGSLDVLSEIKDLVPNSRFDNWLSLMAAKNTSEFKNKQIIRSLPIQASEENMMLVILELDRSFAAQNYSRAKDMIAYLEKKYPDWPDLIFYKYKINFESVEDKTKVNGDQIQLYNNKCKSLNKTIARKYRYDFELCSRGI